MGRPTKLTPELQETIAQKLRKGATQKNAIESSGISEATFYYWMKKGAEAKSGMFLEFSKCIKKALADGEYQLLSDIREDKSWQAKAWILERTRPEIYGKRESVDLTSKGEGINRSIKLEELSNDDLNRIADILRASQTANADGG